MAKPSASASHYGTSVSRSGGIEHSRVEFQWQKTKVHFGVIAAVTIFMLSILAKETRFLELNNELMRREREYHAAQEEKDRLTLQLEHFKTPSRIREIATRDFGLVTPDLTRVHDLATPKR